MHLQRLKQQQALMQQSLYHPGLLAQPQIEPILSGNLPPGFDSSTCRSVYVGNIHPQVTEPLLQEVFANNGPLEGCKLIRKEKSSYGFVDYFDHRSAALAIVTLNGRQLFGQPIKVNWAYTSSQREDTSRKWLGSRQIRCNWATKGAGLGDDQQNSDLKTIVELTNGTSEDGQEKRNEDAPENNPQYTTVYVGNLAPEVTSVDLHRHFHALGVGAIEDILVQRGKGFGFIRYSNHAEAAGAIQMGNAQILFGKPIKCSWGSKPTPPGTSSTPLPPPAATHMLGFTAADLATYERQLALSKMMAGAQALMHPQGQQLAAATQPVYDSIYSSIGTSQQHMFYQ